VLFMFAQKGVIHATGKLSEETELGLIDAGAEDMESTAEEVSVTTDAAKWARVRDALREAGLEVQEAGLKYVAKTEVTISDVQTAQKVLDFIEAIDEDEDVSEVHTNADFTDAVLEQIG